MHLPIKLAATLILILLPVSYAYMKDRKSVV